MKQQTENPMRKVKMEKIILSCRGVKEDLDKGFKLLEKISKKKPAKRLTMKRIPSFGIRPKLEVGCMVTLRGKEAMKLLPRLLASINNELRKKQIQNNHFSFGIDEYIEIPGEEYDRDIGMWGLEVTIVFKRNGKRAKIKKIKRGRTPKKQEASKEEIIKFMEENFQTTIE
ncbi:MAG: 50S ribosomal protein L5 [Candidatus Pacearchaeota archaeon]